MGKAKKTKKLGREDDLEDDVELEADGGEEANPAKSKEKKSSKAKNKTKLEDDVVNSNDDNEEDEEIGNKKKNKKEKKKKVIHEEDDDVDEISKELSELSTTGKSKKDKKQTKKKTADSDDEIIEDNKPAKKDKKKKKKGKTVDDSDSENENKPVVLNDDSDNEVKKKGSKKKASASSAGFALLTMSDEDNDDDDDDGDANSKPQPMSDEDITEKLTQKEKDKGKKGKKKKKNKLEDDEEDIEKVLAELEMEYAGIKKEPEQAVENKDETNETIADEDSSKTKKKKKKKGADKEEEDGGGEVDNDSGEVEKDGVVNGEEESAGTVKTAAQKKKEKKEREKQKKLADKKKDGKKQDQENTEHEPSPVPDKGEEDAQDGEGDEGDDDKKKKKKKGKKDAVDDKKDKKGPGKKTIAAMQEALKKIKEEEERLKKEEEEKQKKLEEAENARLEQLRLEQERKEKKKQKEKERKERLKAEGKLLTSKQKADRARAQAMLDALRAQGLDMPAVGEKKPLRPGTRIRPKKNKQESTSEASEQAEMGQDKKEEISEQKTVQVEIVDKKEEPPKPVEDAVKDSWDAESSEEEEEEKSEEAPPKKEEASVKKSVSASKDESDDESSDSEEEEESSSEEDDSEEETSSEEDDEDEVEKKTDAERRREKALARIQKRREDAEKNKTVDNLRAAVVCVLGHVDTGKTKILDKLRRTNVQDGEAGGITQQIGATNVPVDAIKEQTRIVKGFSEKDLRVPGLLIIDTPGHESFSNLRNRGSSLCDIAILVVDIMHGLEPQTIESITLLKNKKTPFVVALNKIDRLYDWNTMNRRDVRDILKAQASNTQLEFEQRTKEVIVQFAEQGLNAALFYDNPDPRSYVSLVPTSAITGEGMGNLLALIVDSCQNMLAKRLMFSEELQATVLEVKAISGLGTTIDAILVNGYLREGDTMIVAGTDGPIVTQIRSLLMPQPLKELRVKNAYVEYKEIKAAQGVKIAAKDLDKAIAGLNLLIAQKPDEVEIFKDEVAKELKSALSGIRLAERGVYVQASTLGSLEALLEFLRTSKIPYSNIRIGPVVKKDVMKASIMLEHDNTFATILAFDVKVERDAQELADSLGVKIFQADIIYHLFDKFMAYREQLKQKKRDEFKHIAVFPCKLRILPQFIFNSRDPIVMGVMVEAGIIREGTPICVPSREFVELGIVTSIENNHKTVETARKGQEVCIKIEPIAGEAPKMFGRHFDEKDFLISKISRQSIDACKDYFRDDLIKADWQLMVELKKLFQIL